jgi:hypothetical protein
MLSVVMALGLVLDISAQQIRSEHAEKLSEVEKREAEVLADDFMVRFEQSADIKPFIHELYTPDFVRRLRQSGKNIGHLFASLSENVLKESSDEDLVRYHAETLNFTYLMFRHYGAAEWIREQSGSDVGTEEKEVELEEFLPVAAVKLLRANSILIEQLDEDNKKPVEPSGGDSEDKPNRIDNIEQLRSCIATLEKANALMRNSAKTLPTISSLITASEEKRRFEGEEVMESELPKLTILSSEWFGYPSGERLICMEILFFHMDLVRVNGQLKIALLYITVD